MRAVSRRSLLLAVCAGIAGIPPLHAASDAIVLVWAPAGAPPDVSNGVALGAAEAQQTAALLGRTVQLESDAGRPFATIVSAANGVSLRAAGCTFQLSPSAEAKADILARWKQENARNGEYRIAVWHASLKQFGGSDLNERYTRRFHEPMTEGAWLGWVAVKAAVESALRDSAPACAAIGRLQFDGHKGAALSFRNGVLQQPLYVVEGDQVIAEIRQ